MKGMLFFPLLFPLKCVCNNYLIFNINYYFFNVYFLFNHILFNKRII